MRYCKVKSKSGEKKPTDTPALYYCLLFCDYQMLYKLSLICDYQSYCTDLRMVETL